MRDLAVPVLGGSGVAGTIYALAEFSIHNVDILMAALGPFAFRIAPLVPYLDEQALQQLYIVLAILSALLAVWTLAGRANRRLKQ